MKIICFLAVLISSISYCQVDDSSAIKKIAEYSDTTVFYYPFSNPFSYVLEIDTCKSISIQLWALKKDKNIYVQDSLLDNYEFRNMNSGKYLFLWNREKEINYKGTVLMILLFDNKKTKTLVFTIN